MIIITKKYVSYLNPESNRKVSHFILIHETTKHSTLLSHANLFLQSQTRQSKKTSSRYASIISMFYRYLSTLEEFQGFSPSEYHFHVQNKNVKRWQTSREIKRKSKESIRPSSKTIFDEAKLLMNYFRWLTENNFYTGVNVLLKNWIPPFKSARYQEYVSYKAIRVFDSTSIRVLDKENRQASISDQLITPYEIKQLMESYSDPVYAALFHFALDTAMRPMDLCRFPYFGNGDNSHIMPYSSMTFEESTVNYAVSNSKGNKSRDILIHRDALQALEENYIKPYYAERAKKYRKRYGTKPPLSVLFLNKDGRPVTPDTISGRTVSAKKKAMANNRNLRKNIRFYDSRNWWPTQYIIRSFGDDLLKSNEILFNYAVAQVLQRQMGHTFLKTTFDHYIGMARVILSMHQGRKMEIFNASDFSATAFMSAFKGKGLDT